MVYGFISDMSIIQNERYALCGTYGMGAIKCKGLYTVFESECESNNRHNFSLTYNLVNFRK